MKSRTLTLILTLTITSAAFPTDPPADHSKALVEVKRENKIPGGKPLYAESHALIIGINKYPNLPAQNQLAYAVKDATDLRNVLVQNYAFDPQNVVVLTDAQATRENIRQALVNFADSTRVGPDDRLIVYFSGHGQTVATLEGGDMGYLIPSDAKVDLANPKNAAPYLSTCLPMRQIWDYLNASPAKHALVVCDACFSGLMAKKRGLLSKQAAAVMLTKKARMVLTAGGRGEETEERSDIGHGIFTAKLIDELKNRAITPGNVFTASDLFASIQSEVSSATGGKQNPQIGSFAADGDVLFVTGGFASPSTFIDPANVTGVTVSVDSDPPGAEIFVNGVDTRKTTPSDVPVTFPNNAKTAEVKLKRNGCAPITFTVKNAGKDVMLQGKLTQLKSKAKH